jgi:hypothetical protein
MVILTPCYYPLHLGKEGLRPEEEDVSCVNLLFHLVDKNLAFFPKFGLEVSLEHLVTAPALDIVLV